MKYLFIVLLLIIQPVAATADEKLTLKHNIPPDNPLYYSFINRLGYEIFENTNGSTVIDLVYDGHASAEELRRDVTVGDVDMTFYFPPKDLTKVRYEQVARLPLVTESKSNEDVSRALWATYEDLELHGDFVEYEGATVLSFLSFGAPGFFSKGKSDVTAETVVSSIGQQRIAQVCMSMNSCTALGGVSPFESNEVSFATAHEAVKWNQLSPGDVFHGANAGLDRYVGTLLFNENRWSNLGYRTKRVIKQTSQFVSLENARRFDSINWQSEMSLERAGIKVDELDEVLYQDWAAETRYNYSKALKQEAGKDIVDAFSANLQ